MKEFLPIIAGAVVALAVILLGRLGQRRKASAERIDRRLGEC